MVEMSSKKSKIKPRLVGRVVGVKCKECKKGYNLDEKLTFCFLRIQMRYGNQTCSEAEAGKQELYVEDLEKIIDVYLANKEMIEILKEQNEAIKNLLIKELETGSEIVGKYDVKIVSFIQRRLDTEKAREILEEAGKLEECLREVEITYPKISRL